MPICGSPTPQPRASEVIGLSIRPRLAVVNKKKRLLRNFTRSRSRLGAYLSTGCSQASISPPWSVVSFAPSSTPFRAISFRFSTCQSVNPAITARKAIAAPAFQAPCPRDTEPARLHAWRATCQSRANRKNTARNPTEITDCDRVCSLAASPAR
jgi:hypothetical protein